MEPLSKTERKWGELLSSPADACLEADLLLQLATGGRRTANQERHLAHIAECPDCRKVFKELRSVEALRAKPTRRTFPLRRLLPWTAGLAAAAILIAIAIQMLGDSRAILGPAAPIASKEKVRPTSPPPRIDEIRPPRPKSLVLPDRKQEAKVERRPMRRPNRDNSKANAPSRRPAISNSLPEPPIETMDANAGWSRGEIMGEVVSSQIATGEVLPPNSVSGVVGGPSGGSN